MPSVNSKLCRVKELSPEQERAQMLAFKEMGLTNRQIAKRMGKSERWVYKWSSRWDQFGNVKDLERSGRPSKIKGRAKKMIENIKYKRGKSTRKLAKDLKQMGDSVCHATVHNYLRKTKKWKPFKRQKSQFLTEHQMRKRLAFAKKYRHLKPEDWEHYVFSDESTKYLFHQPNQKNDVVWGSQNDEVPDVTCVKNSAKVMIWGAMGARGLSRLHIVPTGTNVTAEYYQTQVLEKELKPALLRTATTGRIDQRRLVPEPESAVFQQDGATPHTALRTQQWCEENLPAFIPKAEWPGNSPDLNVIENLWSILDTEAYKDPTPSTMKQLRRRLRHAWKMISQTDLRALVHSMPDRLENVRKSNGGPSGY